MRAQRGVLNKGGGIVNTGVSNFGRAFFWRFFCLEIPMFMGSTARKPRFSEIFRIENNFLNNSALRHGSQLSLWQVHHGTRGLLFTQEFRRSVFAKPRQALPESSSATLAILMQSERRACHRKLHRFVCLHLRVRWKILIR